MAAGVHDVAEGERPALVEELPEGGAGVVAQPYGYAGRRVREGKPRPAHPFQPQHSFRMILTIARTRAGSSRAGG